MLQPATKERKASRPISKLISSQTGSVIRPPQVNGLARVLQWYSDELDQVAGMGGLAIIKSLVSHQGSEK